MRRLTLLLIVFLSTTPLGSVASRPLVPFDTTLATSRAGDTTAVRLIPLWKLWPNGVRIRSLHDNRRVIILYPVAQRMLPPSLADSAFHPLNLTRRDLEQMESRLRTYIDRRLFELREAQLASLTSLLSTRGGINVFPVGASGAKDVLLVPLPMPQTSAADTTGKMARVPVPSFLASAADSTASVTLRGAYTSPVVDTAEARTPASPTASSSGPNVVEIERTILETGLLRAVSILFEVNGATLLPASISALNSLGYVLTKHPDLRLEIAGYTDSRGTDEYNLRLSQARAEAVCTYLITNFSIDPRRLVARGYGESRPIAGDSTATGRALNRRVEFVLLGSGD